MTISKVVTAENSSTHEVKTVELAPNGRVMENGLQKGLKGRHVQLFALGSVIGSSVWYGGGIGLQYGGPGPLMISFLVLGIDIYFVMQSLAELTTMFPVPGAFNELAARFVDPAASFALAWNYWILWISNLALEYNNFALVLSLWTDKVPTYGWVLVAWTVFGGLCLFDVSVYGEIEFWLALMKVISIFAGFLLAILLNTGAIGGEYIGFRYWSNPGAFVNGIDGFGQIFVLAAAYYAGSEVVALTGAESKSPAQHIPKAIRLSVVRIFVIFVGMMFFTTLLVPYDDPAFQLGTSKAGRSPWTIALNRAGWSGAEHLINVFIVTGLASAGYLYVASRVLVALAQSRRAPTFFAKTTSKGVPVRAIIFCNLFGLVAIMNQFSGAASIFTYITTFAGSATFLVWASIGITHIRFRKAYAKQGFSLEDLPYRASFFPYGAYFIAVFNIFLLFISGYSAFLKPFNIATFITSYLIIAIFLVSYVGWKIVKRTRWVKLEDMDLVTGRVYYENHKDGGPGLLAKCWAWGLSHFCSYFRSPAQTTSREGPE